MGVAATGTKPCPLESMPLIIASIAPKAQRPSKSPKSPKSPKAPKAQRPSKSPKSPKSPTVYRPSKPPLVPAFFGGYAPDSRSTCQHCKQRIVAGSARVSIRYGTSISHYHVDHTNAIRRQLQFRFPPAIDTRAFKAQDARKFDAIVARVRAAKTRLDDTRLPPCTSRFTASYAPTDRARCGRCHEPIVKGSLRLTRTVGTAPTHEAGLSFHYHADHGLASVERVKCSGPEPHMLIRGLSLSDQTKMQRAFRKALGVRRAKCAS